MPHLNDFVDLLNINLKAPIEAKRESVKCIDMIVKYAFCAIALYGSGDGSRDCMIHFNLRIIILHASRNELVDLSNILKVPIEAE